ncbi:hypothetical protein ACC736_38575, partial [Rhizobium ruizarguesonis]
FTVVTTFIFGPYFVSRLTDDPVSAQTTVKKGCAAQSKNIHPQMPFSVAFGGCVTVQSMRFNIRSLF